MIAIMLALALTLATVGMTTLTQHALAYGNGYSCDPPWAYRCNVRNGGYSGYAYIQPAYAHTCSGWTHGYDTEWNAVSQGQTSIQQQKCGNGAILGPGATINCGQSFKSRPILLIFFLRRKSYNNAYNQAQSYHDVDYGGIWVTPSGFSCWGEWRCASGCNHAIVDAQRDLANGATVVQSECPYGHTEAYCNGYTQGYVYVWNLEIANQQGQSQQTIQQQQCTAINSPGACQQEQSSNQ